MAKAKQSLVKYGFAILICVLTLCAGGGYADATYSGGVTVDINEEVLGYLMIEDATVNLLENAWIAADPVSLYPGDIYSTSGSVLNIYGGKIDGALYISSYYNDFPEANVTVYGSDFAVNGVALEPGTPEIPLEYLETGMFELSGVYENGTPFAFNVECFWEGSFYLTVNLGWIEGAPEISVEPTTIDFGQVEVGSTSESSLVTIANNGNAILQLESLNIVQDENAGFGFIPLEQLPTTLEPNSVIDIEVLFAPVTEGAIGAVLQIVSNDPVNPLVEIMLSGAGYTPVLTPQEQMAAIINFYLAGLKDNTIVGIGCGGIAAAKEISLGYMMVCAKNLIQSGYEQWALIPLLAIKGHTDGRERPADLVEGPSVPILNAMVSDLIVYIEN